MVVDRHLVEHVLGQAGVLVEGGAELGIRDPLQPTVAVLHERDLDRGHLAAPHALPRKARNASSCSSSVVTRPPAFRTTMASPISRPKMWVGSTRGSMQVTTTSGRRGIGARPAWA